MLLILMLHIIEVFNIYLILVEWHSMLFIIETQHSRPIEEIVFDHENEPMNINLLSGIRLH